MIEGHFECPTAFAYMASVVEMFRTDLQAPDWFYRGHDDSLDERRERAPFWDRIAIPSAKTGLGKSSSTQWQAERRSSGKQGAVVPGGRREE